VESDRSSLPDAFKALGDPIRWTMVRCMADQPELAGSVLDEMLSISRPTISYHIRILTQAGLVDVSKRGRNHYYTLRHDALRTLLDELRALMPGLQLVHDSSSADSGPTDDPTEAPLPAVLPTW
jgi:DNA-binding transcriptional ArsR family regulator